MGSTAAAKLIESHLVAGSAKPGEEVGLRVDQTLTQDATGTLVMLELEALGLDQVKTEVSVQYVDHNLLQTDNRNADDHLFLQSACRRFGVHFSRPGNGISHPVHMDHFGKPGKTLIGSDSHTCAAGSLGMLAIGVGGLEVAMAMAGEPLFVTMPEVMGIELTGELPPWVSAKDVVLEMLRRHGVKGGGGKVLEYYGPGVATLTAMDRHVIANMGAELGATATVFPSDDETRRFLASRGREDDWTELSADDDASYDYHDSIDLSSLEPLIAKPTSPGNVVPVREVAGEEVYQCVIGSSANPGLRDVAVVASVLQGHQVHPRVSLDVNPPSRQLLAELTDMELLVPLIQGGARLHQSGCLGCIGMGQAPAYGKVSLRTFPRNFPGRSGTEDDRVFLCSPETAVASALTGEITDPRDLPERLGVEYPTLSLPEKGRNEVSEVEAPLPADEAQSVELVKGPNVKSLPEFEPLPDRLELPVELVVGDDISTDEIMPAGNEVLPFRSNIPAISDFVYHAIDEDYSVRLKQRKEDGDASHAIVGGENYGQGSSREHAAIAPRFLGLRLVVAKSYSRIHWQNLANFGIVALEPVEASDLDDVQPGDVLVLENARDALRDASQEVTLTRRPSGNGGEVELRCKHRLSERQVDMVLAGGLIPLKRAEDRDEALPGESDGRPAQSPGGEPASEAATDEGGATEPAQDWGDSHGGPPTEDSPEARSGAGR